MWVCLMGAIEGHFDGLVSSAGKFSSFITEARCSATIGEAAGPRGSLEVAITRTRVSQAMKD